MFFLAEVPTGFDTMRDFRRLDTAVVGAWSVALHEEYRRAHRQREHLLDLNELDDQVPRLQWSEGGDAPDDVTLAQRLREALLSMAPLSLPARTTDPRQHLNAWTAAVEAAGVLVLTTARGRVAIDEARAFSLYFDVVPVIVVNGADSPRGRLFSLLHKYAHLALHTAGLCDTTTDARAVTPDRVLEARCNAIAAAILMPRDLVLASPHVAARASSPTAWGLMPDQHASRRLGLPLAEAPPVALLDAPRALELGEQLAVGVLLDLPTSRQRGEVDRGDELSAHGVLGGGALRVVLDGELRRPATEPHAQLAERG